jgi:hypothetical protein
VEATHTSSLERQGGVTMFATIKSLIPEPRQADQPRRYVGKHRQPEQSPVPETPTPSPEAPTAEEVQPAAV